MTARLDGQLIGKLTVLAPSGEYLEGRRSRLLYTVRCDCGREEQVKAHRLAAGPKQLTACSDCRTPVCRSCGAKLNGPTRRRTCSPQCRRELTALLASVSRDRGGAALLEARVAFNARRLAENPDAQDAKRAGDRARYARCVQDDPSFRDRENARNRDYYDRKSADPAWVEAQRLKSIERRRAAEADAMMRDMQKLGDRDGH